MTRAGAAITVIPCDAPACDRALQQLGGKAMNLFRLRDLGLRVPPFAVIPSRVFDEAIAEIRPAIDAVLRDVDAGDRKGVSAASVRIGEMIRGGPGLAGANEEVAAALAAFLDPATLVSVRSSAVDEDSKQHSFAGMLDSVLNVRQQDVPGAIRRVWASAFSERALLYRLRKRLPLAEATTAVVVQAMVQARTAGVLFTRDPVDLSDACVIAAGLGLGEGVVADAVTTDTYRVARGSAEVSREVRAKESRVVLDGRQGHGTRLEPVPPPLRSAPALGDAELLRLQHAGLAAEERFGVPLDVEWAFDHSGELFILQARPIVLAARGDAAGRRVWDNSNIVESYPGLTLPLTFTFVRAAYERTFRKAAAGFLRGGAGPCPSPDVFANLLGLLDGRVYYNLSNWYALFTYLPASERYREAWDRALGISERTSAPAARVPMRSRIQAFCAALGILLRPRRNAREFFSRFEELYSRHREAAAGATTAEELVSVYRSLEEAGAGFWHLTLYNDFCAIRYHEWLAALCRRLGLDRHAGLQNALLAGEAGVESVAPLRSLVDLADTLRREPASSELFERADDQAVWQELQSDARHLSLRAAVEEHLRAFGDRGIEELKLETKSFRDEPERLIGLIRQFRELAVSRQTISAREQRIRQDAEEQVRRHPMSPLARRVFGFVLEQARFAISARENMRFARSRLFGIVRGLFNRLGVLFAEKGLIGDASDIYLLTTAEVLGTVEGTAVTCDLKALVAIREREYARFAERQPAGRFETAGFPHVAPLGEVRSAAAAGGFLSGTGCGPGRAAGTARIVADPKGAVAASGQILVAKSTDPGWVFLMMASAGIVVEKGSLLSHTAIIGRELGIPTVVGATDATRLIPDGAAITIDGTSGEIRWL